MQNISVMCLKAVDRVKCVVAPVCASPRTLGVFTGKETNICHVTWHSECHPWSHDHSTAMHLKRARYYNTTM